MLWYNWTSNKLWKKLCIALWFFQKIVKFTSQLLMFSFSSREACSCKTRQSPILDMTPTPEKSVSRAESFVSVEECEEQRKGKNHPRIAILNRGVVSCHATWKSVVARLMKVITKSNWMNGWPCAPLEEIIDLNNFLI